MFTLYNPQRLSGVRQLIPRAHFEICRNKPASRNYCRKEKNFYEKKKPYGNGLKPMSHQHSHSTACPVAAIRADTPIPNITQYLPQFCLRINKNDHKKNSAY